MIDKRCKRCGSTFTYAVSSRARKSVDINGNIAKDADGNEIIIMCRHCRACGRDYYIDDKEQFNHHLTESQKKLVDEVLKLRANKKEATPETSSEVESDEEAK